MFIPFSLRDSYCMTSLIRVCNANSHLLHIYGFVFIRTFLLHQQICHSILLCISVRQKQIYKQLSPVDSFSTLLRAPPSACCILSLPDAIGEENSASPTITADGNHIETQLAWALVAMAICSCASAWMRNTTFHRPGDAHGSAELLHRYCACFGAVYTEAVPQGYTLTQPCYSKQQNNLILPYCITYSISLYSARFGLDTLFGLKLDWTVTVVKSLLAQIIKEKNYTREDLQLPYLTFKWPLCPQSQPHMA